MSMHSCTAYFSRALSGEKVMTHLNAAADVIGAKAWLCMGSDKHVIASTDKWASVIGRFASHEYTGEVGWRIGNDQTFISGSITFPIAPPIPIPGTIEFNISWGEFPPKASVFIFNSLDHLLSFLVKIANSVNADGLIVEPKRLPPVIADQRYARFREIGRTKTLSAIDWIIGLRYSDPQHVDLRRLGNNIFRQLEEDGFTVVAFSRQPFDFKRREDIVSLGLIEESFFAPR